MSRQLIATLLAYLSVMNWALPGFTQEPAPWTTRFTTKHVFGEGVGHDQGFTSLDWFLPLNQDAETEMWFGDFRGLMFEDTEFGGNLGAGYRTYNVDRDRIFGINAYWDFRTETSVVFNQLGIGLESLGPVFDFRINGYTPAIHDANQRLEVYRFQGQNVLNRQYNGLSGVDYEAAFNLPDWGSFQSRIAGGGYFFDSSNTEAANGWRARLELAYQDSVAASVVVQDDDVFGRTVNLIVELRTQIQHTRSPSRRSMRQKFRNENGSGDGATVMHRLGDPVQRQQNIVLKQENVVVTDTAGAPLTFLHVVSGAGGDGSIETPFGSITDALADPLAPSSVVFTPEGGNFTEDITLVDGTRLLSNGPVQFAEASFGSFRLPLSGVAPDLGALPATITGNVVLASNTEFSGFDVTGGVSGTAITAANVNNTAIRNSTADALAFTGSGDITVDQVAITMPTGRGIFLDDSAATISNVTIDNAGTEGIDVDFSGGGNRIVSVSDSSIMSVNNAFNIQTTGAGNGFVSVDNLSLASTSGTGFNADGSAGAGTLSINSFADNTVTDAMTGGVVLNSVTFDSDTTTADTEVVSSGSLTIGTSGNRVDGAGLSVTDVSGNWNTGVLSIFNDGGTGLLVDNSTLMTPMVLSNSAGSVIDTINGPAVELNTVASTLLFNSITSLDSPTPGVSLTAVSGTFFSSATTTTTTLPLAPPPTSVLFENIPMANPLTASLGTTSLDGVIQEVGDTTGLTLN